MLGPPVVGGVDVLTPEREAASAERCDPGRTRRASGHPMAAVVVLRLA
jgi:hypothetical protein